jgi:phosphoglycerate dehydrogenase-like enzyme
MNPKILVTPRSVTRAGHKSLDALRGARYDVIYCTPGMQPGADELRTLLPGCIGYLAGVEPITAHVLEAATELRVISRNGVGLDNVDLAAAEQRGIAVVGAEGANARGVAELAIGQLFALARGVVAADTALKRGAWERPPHGVELDGKMLGIAGCGRIGKIVAQMALGIGMKVIAFDPNPDATFAPGGVFTYASLNEVFAHADFLTLHCPPIADGRSLLDAAAVARMKPGVFIINTARFDLLDAGAVLAALDTGHIAGLALDVFDTEPPTDERLARHPRVLATPHIGAFTRESIDRAMTKAVINLLVALQGT